MADKIEANKSAKIEEGDFRSFNYLQEEFDLYLSIKCKSKGGSYNLVLQDGKGNQKSIVSAEEEWEGNIVMEEG